MFKQIKNLFKKTPKTDKLVFPDYPVAYSLSDLTKDGSYILKSITQEGRGADLEKYIMENYPSFSYSDDHIQKLIGGEICYHKDGENKQIKWENAKYFHMPVYPWVETAFVSYVFKQEHTDDMLAIIYGTEDERNAVMLKC